MIKEELIETQNDAQDKKSKVQAVNHFRKLVADKHVLKLLGATAKRSKERILKSIEDDLRDPKNGKLPLFW